MTNTALRTQWLAALRSGDYEQGTGQLRRNDKFCCLGVLCDIDPRVQWEECSYGQYRVTEVSSNNDLCFLPQHLVDELDLTEAKQWELARMNDNRHSTFTDIADYIEENF